MREKPIKSYNILEGALSLTIATVTVKILGAIYKIPLSHILSEEGMGYFNSAYTVYSFFYLLCTAGVPKAIMILVSESDDVQYQKNILKTSLKLFSILGIIVTSVLIMLSKFLSSIIGNPDAYLSMISIAPSIIFASISGVYRGYLSAKVKFMNIAISQIIEGAIKLVLGLILAFISTTHFMSLSTISAHTILGATIGSAVGMIYLFLCVKPQKTGDKIRQKSILNDFNIIKRIIKLSLPIAISAMVMSITNLIDLSMIMNRLQALGYSRVESTALYGNYTTYATPIFNMVISLFAPITVAFMPSLINEKNSIKAFNKLIEHELKTSYLVFIPLVFGICVYSEEILIILFNDSGAYVGSRLLIYLLISMIFLVPLTIVNCGLEALGNVKSPMISIFIGSIFKVVFGYVMISSEKFGIFGAPISTMISYIVSLFVSIFIAHKHNFIPDIIKTMTYPTINSFVSIFMIYPVYVHLCTKYDNMFCFILSVSLTIVLYTILSLIQGDDIKKSIALKKLKA